ncbi:hypothetical protein TNCV_3097551 [Trichonephila clavipes]|nr:hypothetical protein TNCV_3097551 [Trichonephila clavipes]
MAAYGPKQAEHKQDMYGLSTISGLPLHDDKGRYHPEKSMTDSQKDLSKTATAGSDVVQSGRPIFDDFSQHLWPYIGNNAANVVFQMVKRLWLIRIDQ